MTDLFNQDKVIPIKEPKKDLVKEAFTKGNLKLEGKDIVYDIYDRENLSRMYHLARTTVGKDKAEAWQVEMLRKFFIKIQEGKGAFEGIRFTPSTFMCFWKDVKEVTDHQREEAMKVIEEWRNK